MNSVKPRSRKPIKKRTKPRRGPLRCKAYRDWLRQQRCAVYSQDAVTPDGAEHCFNMYRYSSNPIDPAHTQNNGMRSKGPDSSCVPLCREHHEEYDRGRKAFEAKYGVDLKKIAAEHWKRFQEETA
jgi:hypothetical protein